MKPTISASASGSALRFLLARESFVDHLDHLPFAGSRQGDLGRRQRPVGGEGPSLRMSAAVEGVIEAPLPPSREPGSVLSFDFVVMELFPWAVDSGSSPVVVGGEWRNRNLGDRVAFAPAGLGSVSSSAHRPDLALAT